MLDTRWCARASRSTATCRAAGWPRHSTNKVSTSTPRSPCAPESSPCAGSLAGSRPSYGRRRLAEHDTTIATVPFGYADGYPRRLFDGGAEVLINGRRYPLAGDVTMDQLVVDVGDDEVELGDEVVLLGQQGDQSITAEDLADWAGTVSWEILACLGARVPRVLVD